MNWWDFFTWVSSIALAVSALAIFALFLRDARGILERDLHHSGEDSTPDDDR